VAALKARSEDVTRPPADVFADALADLEEAYRVVATERLEPYHADHLAVVAEPR
jgi:fibrillarin-like pre-rRNA processing protein